MWYSYNFIVNERSKDLHHELYYFLSSGHGHMFADEDGE